MPRTAAQIASVYRKKMHRAAVTGNATEMDDAMNSLYNNPNSPLLCDGNLDNVARPETFGPIVEACAICIVYGNDDLANDMFANVEYLGKGFGFTNKHFKQFSNGLYACKNLTLLEADETIRKSVVDTPLEGKVKLNRHVKSSDESI